jgi:histidine triad (HIT) family protein
MTIFQKIIDGEIPCDKLYEDDDVIAFKDIHPQAPFHALVVPRKALRSMAAAEPEDGTLVGKVMMVAAQVAREHGLENDGYRLVTNIGEDGGQTVFHLHVHILGGRPLRGLG